MDATNEPPDAQATRPLGRLFLVCLLAITVFYGVGLTRDVEEPWVGMHDWNGAFYSQLARNLLRYPVSLHWGMPLVGAGEVPPTLEESPLYATHPPGVVWMLLPGFAVLGDSEWVARLPVIACSIVTIVVLMVVLGRMFGRDVAILGGLIYALMPMTVYFGRMVDQEAVCLMFMLLALGAWQGVEKTGTGGRHRGIALVRLMVAMAGGIWVDWPGVLFVGLFCLHLIWAYRKGTVSGRLLAALLVWGGVLLGGLMVYLVYAGLGGHWDQLVSIFLSRAGGAEEGVVLRDPCAPGGMWDHTLENFTGPILALSVLGMLCGLVHHIRMKGNPVSRGLTGARFGPAWVLVVTAIAWIAIFPQQYVKHIYWCYYVGPVIAATAGWGMVFLRDRLRRLGRRLANVALALAVLVLIHSGGVGADVFYTRVSYPIQEVEAWQGIRAMTQSGDRVLSFRNPYREERQGTYRFRNIVPPQIPYYLDRSIGVESNLEEVLPQARAHAVLVMPVTDAVHRRESLAGLERVCPVVQVGSEVVFDLRGVGGEWTADAP